MTAGKFRYQQKSQFQAWPLLESPPHFSLQGSQTWTTMGHTCESRTLQNPFDQSLLAAVALASDMSRRKRRIFGKTRRGASHVSTWRFVRNAYSCSGHCCCRFGCIYDAEHDSCRRCRTSAQDCLTSASLDICLICLAEWTCRSRQPRCHQLPHPVVSLVGRSYGGPGCFLFDARGGASLHFQSLKMKLGALVSQRHFRLWAVTNIRFYVTQAVRAGQHDGRLIRGDKQKPMLRMFRRKNKGGTT